MSKLSWVTTEPSAWLMIPLTGVGIYVAMIALTRVAGLRSFSKMSSTDFATTVAIGSVIASLVLKPQPSLLAGAMALSTLYGIQAAVTWGRRHARWVTRSIDNEPLLLMAGPRMIEAHLKKARVTTNDLHAKLREAGIAHPDDVFAVVMETTGSVSVIKATQKTDAAIFSDVRGADLLFARRNHSSD